MRDRIGLSQALGGVLLVMSVGCHSAPDASRTHAVHESRAIEFHGEPPEARDVLPGEFDFQSKSPLEFLEFLQARYDDVAREPNAFLPYSVRGTHCGWIRESDIPRLMKLVDSTSPCLPVKKLISSFLSMQPSTIGQEAAFLVEGFRCDVEGVGYGGYPPRLNSDSPPTDREAIRAWWESYRDSQ